MACQRQLIRIPIPLKRESYTNSKFFVLRPQKLSDPRLPGSGTEYLGLLGPIIRAEVGDTIVVTFKNNGDKPHNIEPFGLEEDAMAAPVAPGGTAVYTWYVPQEMNPVYGGVDSRLRFYRSIVNDTADSYAGLIGPIVITRHGKGDSSAHPLDVDREIILLFQVRLLCCVQQQGLKVAKAACWAACD